MEPIFQASNAIQAHLVRSYLESEGLPAVVQGEHLSSLVGYLPELSVSVWVRKEDVPQALDLMGEFLEGDEESDFTKCPECGPILDAQAERCWRCGVAA